MIRKAGLACLLVSIAAAAAAEDIVLVAPLDCDLENDCYIQQFVDHDPSTTAVDYRCGTLTQDGHDGTDFAVPSLARMVAGVDVLATASGTITALRDGMADTGYNAISSKDIKGRECGNGAVLSHGEGWETQYCHLKNGSLRVVVGQAVAAGDILGQVGLSGRTEFPHLHLSLRHKGQAIDPFDPTKAVDCQGEPPNNLWHAPIPYHPGGIISVGLATGIPEFDAVKAGTAASEALKGNAPALVVFGYGYGSRAGDSLDLRLSGPDGVVVQQRVVLDRTQAQFTRAIGRTRSTKGWPAGTYIGDVVMRRGEEVIDRASTSLQLR